MSDWQRIAAASFLAGLAVHVAAGGRRPSLDTADARFYDGYQLGRAHLVVVDDLEAADCSDVLAAHGIEVGA